MADVDQVVHDILQSGLDEVIDIEESDLRAMADEDLTREESSLIRLTLRNRVAEIRDLLDQSL